MNMDCVDRLLVKMLIEKIVFCDIYIILYEEVFM